MFRLLRYFAITSLLAFAIVAVLLGAFYRQTAVDDLIDLEESKNVALAQAFANSLWPQFAPFVASASGLSHDELRAHPEIVGLHQAVLAQMQGLSVLKVKIYSLDGRTVFSTEAKQIGEDKSSNAGFLSARSGQVASELTHRDTFSAFEGVIADRDVLSSYIPVRQRGQTMPIEGVFEIYSDVTPLLERIDRSQGSVVAVVTLVLASLYAVLFFAVRRADGIIRRQNIESVQVKEALQRAHGELEKRVTERTEQLQASAEVGRATASILDPNQLLREVVNLITDRFGYYYAAVFTLDEAGKFAVLREATGEAGQALKQSGHKLEVGGQSMVGYATAQRKPRIALDVGDADRTVRFANPLLPDTRSEIALPLVVGTRVLGALDVQSTQAAAFDGGSMAVLQSMADQVAVSLANAQSFGALQAALQTTTRLYEVSRALFAAASPREAYAAAVRDSAVLPGLDRVSILTVATRDPDGEPIEYEVAAEWDAPSRAPVEPGARATPAQFPLLNLVDRESIVVVRDADEPPSGDLRPRLPASWRLALQQAGLKAAALVPLIVRGQFEGFLAAVAGQPLDFSDGDIRYMQATAEQLAVVMGSLRASQETQAALERVALLNRRLSGEAWQRYLAARQNLAVESGQFEAAQDASRLSQPIIIRGQTLGVVDLEDADPDRQWTADERDLLSAVAGEVALAIENARLIEQTQLRAARQAQLNQIAEKIRRTSDIQAILHIAVEELGRTLDTSHANARLGAPATVAASRHGASVRRKA